MSAHPSAAEMQEVTLLDVVDTALDKGVVVQGEATISVADVDLVFLGLKLVLASVETMESRSIGGRGRAGQWGGNHALTGSDDRAPASAAKSGTDESPLSHCTSESAEAPHALTDSENHPLDPDKVEQGLAKLVLTVVELLRRLLERQALRRMEGGSLSDVQIERMGRAFQRLEHKMEQLKGVFGLERADLNLALGPLGNLM